MTFLGNPAGYPQLPQQYYAPRQVWAGLGKRQKRAAFWAGAIGLNLLNLGGGLLLATLVVGVIVIAFAGYSASADATSGLRGFDEFVQQLGAPIWLVIAAVVGLVVVAIGLLSSVGILRAGQVARPWAVTWSAFGISIPVIGVLNFVGGIIVQLVTTVGIFTTVVTAASDGRRLDEPSVALLIGLGIAGVVISVVAVGLVGWLAWWWMTHAFRPRVAIAAGVDGVATERR